MFQLKIRVYAFNCFLVASFYYCCVKIEFKMHWVSIGIIENMP